MSTAVVLFTRDLRVRDHPALGAAAAAHDRVVPVFVLDDRLLTGANRTAFLLEAVTELCEALSSRGAPLVIRQGDAVDESMRLAHETHAQAIYLSADVSRYARSREARLARACEEQRIALHLCPGVTVVEPGELTPAGQDHFQVFTPYWRRWAQAPLRPVQRPPHRLQPVSGIALGKLPALPRGTSPDRPRGGEEPARKRLERWLRRGGLERYEALHDHLAADGTSRLSPYLHFGCLSPRALVERVEGRDGAEPFLRQLCWRDFFHQLLWANPDSAREDYRPRRAAWNEDPEALEAWKAGETGVPIVDAGMRQLAREGFMHNRARLIVASYLTRDLGIDWRAGARHFRDLLADGDLASNAGNWQWVAGTGANRRPNRVMNVDRQARRFDPSGAYVGRYVPELATVPGPQ